MTDDQSSYSRARKLQERIETYWRERGATVCVELQEAAYVESMRTGRFDVRSDMLNGWPCEWVK